MKTTSIKGVLSFCVAVTVTVAMAYSAVTVIQKNNAATEKAVKESQAIGSEVSTDSLKDGEYEGTATGYGGPLTVRITIKGGKLTDIKVVSHTETPEYFSRASAVIGKILNSGNVNVDSVSGATISSNAIKKAVADALRKAGSKQKAKMSTVKKDTRNANLNDGVSTESGSGVSTDNLKDGEYEATATGYGGPLTVRITIKGGKLTDIKVVSHTETPEYFSRASAVIGKILNSGNVNVDSVSGATISSNAIKKAVADALRKAGSKQQAKMSTVKKDTRNANLNDRVSTGSGSEVSTDSLSLIVLSHTVVFGVHYFPMLFTNPAAMPTRQMIAAIVTIILLAMLIPLFITSFKSVRRKMNGKTWKNIQRMAYPFFIGIYVHIMVLYSADVKSHMTGIIVYTVIYACYVILRLRKAALKSRKAKIATA